MGAASRRLGERGARGLVNRSVGQAIPDAPDVDDVAVAAHAELVAQTAGMRIQRSRRGGRMVAPDGAQQLLLREDPRRLGRERAQERELLLADEHLLMV